MGIEVQPSKQQGIFNVVVHLSHAEGLHHSDAPECDGCCKGQGGPLIQGSPRTGDAWVFSLSDGSHANVCDDASIQGCDGQAHPQSDGSIRMSVQLPANVDITSVTYGGVGPWLGNVQAQRGGEQCVYPHAPRFGLKACALYNGDGGYDAYVDGVERPGIVM